MAIVTIQQSTEVSEVGLVTISDVVEDEEAETTTFVREIKAFGVPDIGGTRTLMFTLRLTAATEAGVKLQAPEQTF
jgi:hypothetical protein